MSRHASPACTSLADGLKLIARRGRLMQGVAGHGAMSAVRAPEDRVREALRGLEQRVTIAAMNAPESVVISGYEQELQIAEQRLMETGVNVQRLNVSHAFHSPQMREMEEAFEAVASEIQFQPPRLRLVSSVTGRAVAGDEMSHAAYWRRQVSEPVRFREAMETLRESAFGVPRSRAGSYSDRIRPGMYWRSAIHMAGIAPPQTGRVAANVGEPGAVVYLRRGGQLGRLRPALSSTKRAAAHLSLRASALLAASPPRRAPQPENGSSNYADIE